MENTTDLRICVRAWTSTVQTYYFRSNILVPHAEAVGAPLRYFARQTILNGIRYQESKRLYDSTSSWHQSAFMSFGVKLASGHGDVEDQTHHGNWTSGIKI